MPRTPLLRLAIAFLAASALVAACSGRPNVEPPPADLGVVAGRVIKSSVKEATVTVYRLDGTKRGASLGTASTDADGAFRIGVGAATGPFVVVATGGAFVDEASGVTVSVGSGELSLLVAKFDVETKLESLRITPVSHLAAGLALYWVDAEGLSLADADAEAWQHLNAHFGALDWRTSTPLDLPTATGATLDESARAGLLLAALSFEARLIGDAAGLTPGGRVNPMSLTTALYDDVTKDGFFDGVGSRGVLALPLGTPVVDAGVTATPLGANTLRASLATAIARFLQSDRNASRITVADAQSLAVALAGNNDTRIFRNVGTAADITAPVGAWLRPMENAGVRGVIDVEVSAVDETQMGTLSFLAPAGLVDAGVTTLSTDGKTAHLTAQFDVSSLQDGPLELRARAVDAAGNAVTFVRSVAVSQNGPEISVATPTMGAVVRGVVPVAATASARAPGATLTKLELRSPTTGVGPDTQSAASTLSLQWTTTGIAEGPLTLVFHAEDSMGGSTDLEVPVTVDNVDFGTVNAFVSAGGAVGGADVQLLAVDSTGAALTARDGGAVLGTGVTDGDGGVSFRLTQENYVGPVQLVVSGSNLSVVDPTDGTTPISWPATLHLTSYYASYRTGDTLNAHATLYTTIADAAAKAYAAGLNASSTTPLPLGAALGTVDVLFSGHVSRPQQWSLRAARPASLVDGRPQTLRDTVYAAFPDVALHQLARDLSVEGGLTPGATVTAFTLSDMLVRDVSDGLFDGRAGTQQLTVPGMPMTYALDANTSRFKLAGALDRFLRTPRNNTGLQRVDVQSAGVFDNLCSSAPPQNPFYSAMQPPLPFDSQPPTVTFVVTYSNGAVVDGTPVHVGNADVFGGTVSIVATAVDPSGMRSTEVRLGTSPLTPLAGNNASRYGGTYTPTASGALTFVARACDSLGNCGTTSLALSADIDAPVVTVAQPTGQRVRLTAPVDATAADVGAGVASFVLAGFASFVDTNSAVERIQGTWSVPMTTAEGLVTATLRACDAVGNCGNTPATVVVDKSPPTSTFTVTYGSSNTAPYGTSRIVAGTVHVAVTSTDGAGLASVAVTQGATSVASAMGTAAASVSGDFVTSADGSLSFVARACDLLGNCGDTTYTVVVDNTAPTFAWAAPVAAGWYSTSMPVDVTASDANGLRAAATLTGALGFVDNDAALERVFGTWAVPSMEAQGPKTLTVSACDVVGNCSTGTRSIGVDTEAPTTSEWGAPPRYIRISLLGAGVFGGNCVDALSGVSGARFEITPPNGGAATQLPGVDFGGGSYGTGTAITFQDEGDYIIRMWCIDNATPGNSGQASPVGPYLMQWLVTVDRSAPVVGLFTPPATYRSEVGLSFAKDGAGAPIVPTQWQYAGGALDLYPTGRPIFKSSSRLSWGSSMPTAAEIESSNVANVPWMQLQVPLTGAPLTGGRYRFSVTDSAVGATTTAWVPLQPAANSGGATQLYNLLISLETLPQLATPTLPGNTVTFRAEVEVTDSALNVGSWTSDSRVYTLVAPPIAVVQDSAYAARGDTRSLYNYRIANNTYASLWDVNNPNFVSDPFIRVTRSVVYNPSNVPIAVNPTKQASSAPVVAAENWASETFDLPGTPNLSVPSPTFVQDAITFNQFNSWDSRPGSSNATVCGASWAPFPCGAGNRDIQVPRHTVGSGTPTACIASSTVPPKATASTINGLNDGAFRYRAFKNPVTAPTGVETTTADSLNASTFIVPANSAIALYTGILRPISHGRPLTYQTNGLNLAAGSRYQLQVATWWRPTGQNGLVCSAGTFNPNAQTELYRAAQWWEWLTLARTTATVNLDYSTGAVTGPSFVAIGNRAVSTSDSNTVLFDH